MYVRLFKQCDYLCTGLSSNKGRGVPKKRGAKEEMGARTPCTTPVCAYVLHWINTYYLFLYVLPLLFTHRCVTFSTNAPGRPLNKWVVKKLHCVFTTEKKMKSINSTYLDISENITASNLAFGVIPYEIDQKYQMLLFAEFKFLNLKMFGIRNKMWLFSFLVLLRGQIEAVTKPR